MRVHHLGTVAAGAFCAMVFAPSRAVGDSTTTSAATTTNDALIPAMQSLSSVPEAFALELLGNPDLKVLKPGSIKTALSELQAFYKDGKLQPGVAIEVSPFALGVAKNTTYEEYNKRKWWRFWARATASLATVASGTGDDSVVRAAGAIRFRLWDKTDWRLNPKLNDCLHYYRVALLKRMAADMPTTPSDDSIQPSDVHYTDDEKAGIKRCVEDNIAWNAPQSAVGVGVTTLSPKGSLSDTQFESAAAWWGLADPLNRDQKWFLLTLALRYSYYADVPATASMADVPAHHIAGLGIRLSFKSSRVVFNLEGGGGVQVSTPVGAPAKVTGKGLVGAALQVRLFGDTWSEISLSGDLTASDTPNKLIALTNLKWNYDLLPTN